MAIEWNESLATGVESIDKQHKELFARINRLLEACMEQKGASEIADTVAFLEDYVASHFSNEERQMYKYAYKDYDEHKKLHEEFVENFKDLKELFKREGTGPHVIVKINHVLVEWLTKHIKKVDKAMGAFLKDKIKEA